MIESIEIKSKDLTVHYDVPKSTQQRIRVTRIGGPNIYEDDNSALESLEIMISLLKKFYSEEEVNNALDIMTSMITSTEPINF